MLATPLVEKLHQFFPHSRIDFLLRKGNEGLLHNHPLLSHIWVWDKREGKYAGLWCLLRQIRKQQYDLVINCQRFAASGFLTAFSAASQTCGFRKNPFSLLFTHRIEHRIGTEQSPAHEVERNLALIASVTDTSFCKPKLYPSVEDQQKVAEIKGHRLNKYVCIAPTSVWHTKQYPPHKWVDLIHSLPGTCDVYLLGASGDFQACQHIAFQCPNLPVFNLSGQLSLLQSASLMQGAVMNYVNDSAPLHIASAMNAPVTAVFCSTIPAFGFAPLSDDSHVVQTPLLLSCRPCGLHGYAACPQGHFQCAESIQKEQFYLDRRHFF